ncbi:hypothetical protein L083_1754 [Actinoplanes sp. N902-109]|nr:hypothetical protein L083_1754 [Actinoplanes sp. N902-109]
MQGDRRGQDASNRPLDVLAHGEWGRVDVYDATRWHGDLPETEVRLPLRPRPRLIVLHDAGWYGWCARETAISTCGLPSRHIRPNGSSRPGGAARPSSCKLAAAFSANFRSSQGVPPWRATPQRPPAHQSAPARQARVAPSACSVSSSTSSRSPTVASRTCAT